MTNWTWPYALRADLLKATLEQRREISRQMCEVALSLLQERFYVWDDKEKKLVQMGKKLTGSGSDSTAG